MFEPRGHYDMYGVHAGRARPAGADLAVLFMHNEGYSHHVRPRHDRARPLGGRPAASCRRREPETARRHPVPLRAGARCVAVADGRPAPCASRACRPSPSRSTAAVEVPGFGPVDARHRLWRRLLRRAAGRRASGSTCAARRRAISSMPPTRVTEAAQAPVPLAHPDDPDLAFLYGTILTDGGDGCRARPPPMSASSPSARSTAARPAAASPRASPSQHARGRVRLGRDAALRKRDRRGLHRPRAGDAAAPAVSMRCASRSAAGPTTAAARASRSSPTMRSGAASC